MNERQAEMEQFHRDTQYYGAHWEELLEQYPEHWVAIYKEQVVGTSPDARQLLVELKQRGIPIGETLFKYLTHKEELWILRA